MEKVDLEFSLEPVPQAHRNGFWKILAVMLGFTFFSASMWAGGTLGNGLRFSQFIWIVLAGNLILGVFYCKHFLHGSMLSKHVQASCGINHHVIWRRLWKK